MEEPEVTAALLAVAGLLLTLAGLASRVSDRFGIPALILFLGLGVAAGSEGFGGIDFSDYTQAFRLGTFALVLILFDGGLNTSPSVLRRALVPASLLATVSVGITALVVAGAGLLLDISAPIALLIGSVVASTEAAAVFSILRGSGVSLGRTTGGTLEVESGLNDPMAIFLTITMTELVLSGDLHAGELAWSFAQQILFGVLGGVGAGYAGRWFLRVIRLPAAGLYPVLTVSVAMLAFGIPTLIGGSGFLSVYITAIMLGSGSLPYRAGVRRVHDALAWLAQIVMFLMLGLLVYPSRLLPGLWIGLVLAAVLAFVARPLAVLPVLALFPMTWRERFFIAWVGLRGAVPIVLAAYPVLNKVPAADEIFHVVFFVVLINSFIPGATVPWLAKRLGLARLSQPVPAASIELISLREFSNQFLSYNVSAACAVSGSYVRDLPLPESCLVTLVVRDGQVITPRGDTQLQVGDQVSLFVTPAAAPLVALLFGGEADDF